MCTYFVFVCMCFPSSKNLRNISLVLWILVSNKNDWLTDWWTDWQSQLPSLNQCCILIAFLSILTTNENNAARRRRKVVPATYRLSNSEVNQAPPLPSLHWRCCLATAGRLSLSLVAIATPCRAADTCKRMTNIHFSLASSPFHLSHPFLLLSPLLLPYPSVLPSDPLEFI